MFKKIAIALGIILMLGLIYWLGIRTWHVRWGATDAEISMALPGDDLVAGAAASSTRAITIHAPAPAIYPWLVQMGQGRGGLYSYDWLENLVGCDIHSVDKIVPELQNPPTGTAMRLGPWNTLPYYRFVLMIPDQAVILRSIDPATGQPSDGLWMFVLQPVDAGTTRLIVRHREVEQTGVGSFIMNKLMVEPISFVMERKMMYGIRDRAEALARAGAIAY